MKKTTLSNPVNNSDIANATYSHLKLRVASQSDSENSARQPSFDAVRQEGWVRWLIVGKLFGRCPAMAR